MIVEGSFGRPHSRNFWRISGMLTVMAGLLLVAFSMHPRARLDSSQAVSAQKQWSVLFYYAGDPVPLKSLPWKAVTHVTVIAIGVNPEGSLAMGTPNPSVDFPEIVNAAHANGRKALINLNDIGNGSTNMAAAVSCCLGKMVSNVNNFVNHYGFDGIELDWERTLPASNRTHSASLETNLTRALRDAMGSTKNLIVDVFACCAGSNWKASIPYVDRFAMMTYDEGPGHPFSWFNSPLYNPRQYPKSANNAHDGMSADGSLYYMTNSPWNFPMSKLMIGIPTFGEHVSGPTSPRQSTTGMLVRQRNYYDMYSSHNRLAGAVYDSEASAAWLRIAGGYLSFETPQTIANKIRYVKTRGAGGWIIFTLRGDYLPSQNPSHPLVEAIAGTLESERNTTSCVDHKDGGSEPSGPTCTTDGEQNARPPNGSATQKSIGDTAGSVLRGNRK